MCSGRWNWRKQAVVSEPREEGKLRKAGREGRQGEEPVMVWQPRRVRQGGGYVVVHTANICA